MSPTWKVEFQKRLIERYGDEVGSSYGKRYKDAIPDLFIQKIEMADLVDNVAKIELLNEENQIEISLCNVAGTDKRYAQVLLFEYGHLIPLSDILPILDNLGLRVYRQDAYEMRLSDSEAYTVTSFDVDLLHSSQGSLDTIKKIFEVALKSIINAEAENDEFNKLIISSKLTCSQANIIRAYAKYLAQIGFRYGSTYIVNVFLKNVALVSELVALFENMHNPNMKDSERSLDVITNRISALLDDINDINVDNIVRRYQGLIDLTVRTNYFKNILEAKKQSHLTLKLMTSKMSFIPDPKPLIDTFVYSHEFEGIHLRCSKVSRGGIRWSERHDDYRDEIFELMKAQKVTNSVIIPSGAKGGFIIKDTLYGTPEGKPVEYYYREFIRGLLDVVDDMKNGEIIKPDNIVCYDDGDPYFVIAVDKGTRQFLDIANEISCECGFWLGDAFASGGKGGYDHKALGITARGAWESLKRSLQELNLIKSCISVVGIGDMGGDVFGNSLIYSKNIKLVAAFNHQHVFIDPNPDPTISYEERQRLYNLPKSSWADYDEDVMSTGARVYDRSQKSVKLTPEINALLGISDDELTPDQLICAILKAKVDVLFNGGIGTYVKASSETSEDVGEKTNELCRINGNELRCKIVCEGGSFGFTQLGRVEYALNGGVINTDFIDNSAGVNCSDHEVNIKLFLNDLVDKEKISIDQRNEMLYGMQDDVCKLVLHESYDQALLISFSSLHAYDYMELYQEYIAKLEVDADLDRKEVALPSDKDLSQRKASGKGLTKPELAVLLAYTKIYVKDELLKSGVSDTPILMSAIGSAFPARLTTCYKIELKDHLLREEIIATVLANQVINSMGVTFPFRLQDETGSSIRDIMIAYRLVSEIFEIPSLYKAVKNLDNKVAVGMQYKLYHMIRKFVNMATRWFLRNGRLNSDHNELIQQYKSALHQLRLIIPTLIVGDTKKSLEKNVNKFVDAGLTDDIAITISTLRVMYTALNIHEVSSIHHFDLIETAHTYFDVGKKFGLVWIRDFLAKDNRAGKRNSHARLTIRDNLDILQRRLVILIMQSNVGLTDKQQAVENWIELHAPLYARWNAIQKELVETHDEGYTTYFTALHELSEMIDGMKNMEKSQLLAYHDPLTSLPNRLSLLESIETLCHRHKVDNSLFAVHFLDLNKFKFINDTYGHEVGDKVLIEFTNKLLSCIRSGDIVARHAGDEFIIVQSHVENEQDAIKFADRVSSVVREPVVIDGIDLELSASIGIALYPIHGKSTQELIKQADHAMYQSKSARKAEATMVEST